MSKSETTVYLMTEAQVKRAFGTHWWAFLPLSLIPVTLLLVTLFLKAAANG